VASKIFFNYYFDPGSLDELIATFVPIKESIDFRFYGTLESGVEGLKRFNSVAPPLP